MRELLFDVETNGLLDELDRVHSLVIKDYLTGSGYSCHNQPTSAYRAGEGYEDGYTVRDGLKMLAAGGDDIIVGHNIIRFDMRALKKVYPMFDVEESRIVDTLLLSRLIWPDLKDRDAKLIKKGKLPPKLRGSHGLKAWGIRLGILKGDFSEGTDWQHWSPAMQSYCEQDVEVTAALWKLIKEKQYSERAIRLEHEFAQVIDKQIEHGFKFNKEAAAKLYGELVMRRSELDAELKDMFPPWYVRQGEMVPKRSNKSTGYVEGAPFTKIKLQEFNPASRQQIADRLIHLYGWKPEEETESGQPKIDETVLGELDYPPAKLLAERFTVEKRIGQLAEGQAGWLRLERNGRLHGSVNTNGAVTGRCTHSAPNMAQVPSCGAPYGSECRSLFTVDDGYVLIGCDASQLELVCLAHYMSRWDGGAYAEIIVSGDKDLGTDIHTANMKAAGLPTRDNAKTFIYGYLYGAGDAKIGAIIGKNAAAGKKLKQQFLKQLPALAKLKDAIEHTINTRGYLIGIDGRHLHIRSAHAALNTLLQSAGGLLVKQATVFLYHDLSAAGYEWGKDWAMVAHVHDEYQLQVRKEIAEDVAEIAVEAFRKAGREFNWKCPLDGEAQIGNNWAETH